MDSDRITQRHEEKFKVRGYPIQTCLSFPDGINFLKQGMVNEDFFDKYITTGN